MFKPVTVESITRSLSKMIEDLNSLTTKHNAEITANNVAISNLSADNTVLTAEIIRANVVSKKLESLLSI